MTTTTLAPASEYHLGRVAEQRHIVDQLDDAFAKLAVDHPERCSTKADYPDWSPHVAHTLRAQARQKRRPRPYRMIVADLKALLADVPDWAAVEVLHYDEDGVPEERDPYIDYAAGILTIDVA